jgi:hypothetical protein
LLLKRTNRLFEIFLLNLQLALPPRANLGVLRCLVLVVLGPHAVAQRLDHRRALALPLLGLSQAVLALVGDGELDTRKNGDPSLKTHSGQFLHTLGRNAG